MKITVEPVKEFPDVKLGGATITFAEGDFSYTAKVCTSDTSSQERILPHRELSDAVTLIFMLRDAANIIEDQLKAAEI